MPDANAQETAATATLAPLRGVTVRCFRETFADAIREAGFSEAVTPFVAANPGVDPLRDRELSGAAPCGPCAVTPQFIGKDPAALRDCLLRVRAAGFATADLNCGCPFPMVRGKGRGSGLLRTPAVLEKMLAAGCEAMGEGAFSVKTRLGIDSPDEILRVMPVFNAFPLRRLTIHARTARQMYTGECDVAAFRRAADMARAPVAYNGDAGLARGEDGAWRATVPRGAGVREAMVGRAFVRALAHRPEIRGLLDRYVEASLAEFGCEKPVLGRMKELLAYWKELPGWRRVWEGAKLSRSLCELALALRVVRPATPRPS